MCHHRYYHKNKIFATKYANHKKNLFRIMEQLLVYSWITIFQKAFLLQSHLLQNFIQITNDNCRGRTSWAIICLAINVHCCRILPNHLQAAGPDFTKLDEYQILTNCNKCLKTFITCISYIPSPLMISPAIGWTWIVLI